MDILILAVADAWPIAVAKTSFRLWLGRSAPAVPPNQVWRPDLPQARFSPGNFIWQMLQCRGARVAKVLSAGEDLHFLKLDHLAVLASVHKKTGLVSQSGF